MKVGITGGSNLYKTLFFVESRKQLVETEYGSAEVYLKDNVAFIPRHGSRMNIPPHKINHRANMQAFQELGVSKILAVCMTGSLKKKIKPPVIVIPDDYVSFWNIPTFFDDRIVHINPMLDEALRKHIIETARKNKIKIYDKGVYVQTHGPRFETEAEINILKNFGDVVGMTMASEATLAQELGVGYAAVCSVDNYAHGIANSQLDFKKILENATLHSSNVVRLVVKAVEGLR
ncbi:MAG: MTAP family purine nucleoside phosphorylase [Candidatus Altiarchaeales archaeon]|nr:MTAP family purine nucleoside phosphorylase [Candidatus Altiarchaeales archaeon]